MQTYTATLVHVIGYNEDKTPILKSTDYTVEAVASEKEAIRLAKENDSTGLSVYESYAAPL